MKTLAAFMITALLASCATFQEAYPQAAGKSLIKGESSGSSSVMVRQVGGGGLNFGAGYRLRDSAWVAPGEYDVSFMVESAYSWGTTLKPANRRMKIENGYNYFVTHDPSRDSEREAHVTVSKMNQ